jgi:hypothetical protein
MQTYAGDSITGGNGRECKSQVRNDVDRGDQRASGSRGRQRHQAAQDAEPPDAEPDAGYRRGSKEKESRSQRHGDHGQGQAGNQRHAPDDHCPSRLP